MTPKTLWRFLCFDRGAILALAADKRTALVGLLFVFSAALAREYDAQYLIAEPWHLLIPLGASLVAATVLFLVLSACFLLARPGRPRFINVATSFLGLFWMTAPLAWVYAIPYERFLPPEAAAYANLTSLGVVALWRVALMMRVAQVLFHVNVGKVIWPVMLVGDVLAFAALSQLDARILALMGGVQLSDAEEVLRSGAMMLMIGGYLSMPVWLLSTLIVFVANLVRPKPFPPLPGEEPEGEPEGEPEPVPGRPAWILAGGAIGVGLLLLPFTQPEQYRRHQVEVALARGDYDTGLVLLCKTQRGDFPPHWDPPPRSPRGGLGKPSGHPDLLLVTSGLAQRDPPAWVIKAYTPELSSFAARNLGTWSEPGRPRQRLLLETLLAWPDASVTSQSLEPFRAFQERMLEGSPDPIDVDLLKRVIARGEAAESD